jgi:hypothetical protein
VLLDGAEGEGGKSVVGDTWEDIVGLAEDVAGWMEKGCAGDTEGLRNGGRDEFEVERVENEAEDQVMGMEVVAATEDGVVSCDFGGGESLDCEVGSVGGDEFDDVSSSCVVM